MWVLRSIGEMLLLLVLSVSCSLDVFPGLADLCAMMNRFNGRNLMSVTFPWFSPTESELVRVKVRAIEDKKCMKLDPSGNIWGFFG